MRRRRALASVDALRGTTVAAMLLVNNPGDWGHVYAPLLHAHWHGCTPTDLIFPFFLFIVGVSIAHWRSCRGAAGAAKPRWRGGVDTRRKSSPSACYCTRWRGGAGPGLVPPVGRAAAYRPVFPCRGDAGVEHAAAAAMVADRRAADRLLGRAGRGRKLRTVAQPRHRVDTALFAPLLYRFDPPAATVTTPKGC
jgi:hypothetical protein